MSTGLAKSRITIDRPTEWQLLACSKDAEILVVTCSVSTMFPQNLRPDSFWDLSYDEPSQTESQRFVDLTKGFVAPPRCRAGAPNFGTVFISLKRSMVAGHIR
jgi:hypothetical protein